MVVICSTHINLASHERKHTFKPLLSCYFLTKGTYTAGLGTVELSVLFIWTPMVIKIAAFMD